MSRVHLSIKKEEAEKDINTTVSTKAQDSYKKKCEELGIKYIPVQDAPTKRMENVNFNGDSFFSINLHDKAEKEE